jgi:hypothetical protein
LRSINHRALEKEGRHTASGDISLLWRTPG